jgi:hypothetical protein
MKARKKNPCGLSNKQCCILKIAAPCSLATLIIFVLAFSMSSWEVEDECGEFYLWDSYFLDMKDQARTWGASDLMLEAIDRAKQADQLSFICPDIYENEPERKFVTWTEQSAGEWY